MTRYPAFFALIAMAGLAASLTACLTAGPALAVTLPDCTRTTHISHGGEAGHRDLGEGRVMWHDWWSQEGTATDFTIAQCETGEALMFRTAEERMNARLPFDRTGEALAVVARHEAGARVFATFERMADDLKTIARDIEIKRLEAEPCACAALYPETRGARAAFEMEGG